MARIPDPKKVVPCRYCQKPIRWIITRNGANMPIEEKPYNDEILFDRSKHEAHWGNCPAAEQARQEKKRREAKP